MFKRMFGLNDKEKTTLKALGLKDSDLEEIEKVSLSVIKRNLVILPCMTFLVGIILGKIL